MATKPTREQQHACDQFAEALVLITEGARRDGRGTLDRDDLRAIAERVARASSAFGLDEIVVRALEKRSRSLGLREGTADLLTLLDADVTPLAMLAMADDDFKGLVAKLEEELGEV